MARKSSRKEKTLPERMQGFIVGIRSAGEIQAQDPSTTRCGTNYMPYAMSVIMSRAMPEIDGFKPSHRKLLYTMYKMNLLGSARTQKREHRRSDDEAEPAWRQCDLRHDGASFPRLRGAFAPLCGL